VYEPAVTADLPGPGAVARRAPVELPRREGREAYVVLPALVVAGALMIAWLAVYPHTPDLAAQTYRVDLFRRIGFAIYDEHWYAGHSLPGYSLLFPALGVLLGARTVGVLSVLVSTALFALLVAGRYGRGARAAAVAFAVAAAADAWQGRLAFALGVAVALGAGLAYVRDRTPAAVALAALSAAASPVAALGLGIAALTGALTTRSLRPLAVLAVPGAIVVLAMAVLFPEGGTEPYPTLSFLATAAAVFAFTAAAGREERGLRIAGPLYLFICLLFLVIHSPVGSNVERYGVLLAAPMLLLARPRPRGLALAALAGIALWVVWGPFRETVAVEGEPATRAAYYEPVERFVDGLGGRPVRIEVPSTRSRWEAALLAPRVSLARGWEKQLDERYDGVLLGHGLTAASYRRWLEREAVAYVALPDAPLDPASAAEGRLIRGGLPYLVPVARSAHWRIYSVQGARPLVSGAATLSSLGNDSFTLRASAAGPIEVRVHDSRWWTVTAGRGCVGSGPEGFTEVRAGGPGTITVAARFSLSRALGSGPACRR
jgi:hypothetical protein